MSLMLDGFADVSMIGAMIGAKTATKTMMTSINRPTTAMRLLVRKTRQKSLEAGHELMLGLAGFGGGRISMGYSTCTRGSR